MLAWCSYTAAIVVVALSGRAPVAEVPVLTVVDSGRSSKIRSATSGVQTEDIHFEEDGAESMRSLPLLVWLVAALALQWCLSADVAKPTGQPAPVFSYSALYVEVGGNIGSHVRNQLLNHFYSVPGLTVYEFLPAFSVASKPDSDASVVFDPKELLDLGAGTLILSLGNASFSQHVIGSAELGRMPAESFMIKGKLYDSNCSGISYLASNGRRLSDEVHKNVSFDTGSVHYGAVLSAYATLELLGFAFLHPLEPYRPPVLAAGASSCTAIEQAPRGSRSKCARGKGARERVCHVAVQEAPHWPQRSFHIHTQHPLELTEVLQGYDIPQFGPHGPDCVRHSGSRTRGHDSSERGSSPYCERWEDMIEDVNLMFEWAVANRQNKIEWLLLGSYKWGNEHDNRMKRLRALTSLGHAYSIMVGADCPLGNVQQHAFHIVNTRLPFKQQVKQIRTRIDWIFHAGFDFLTTESGLSEFTHPECDLMLDLMNEFANYVNGTWGREAAIKVHCSTGQVCDGFRDPVDKGKKLNFNFLPFYANSTLGVFPHTVQVYALDDPTAGAYGNDNFSYIEEYLVHEAKAGARSVVYYGETAYWVNVDVDVPLFLPIYGQRRLHDLRRIAGRERAEGFRIQGQMNFDSGWEWGYWLSDVVTARAAWDPLLAAESGRPGYAERDDQYAAFARALLPVTSIFGEAFGPRLRDIVTDLVKAQSELLLLGRVDGEDSPNLKKLSGIAYLSGADTWVDVPRRLGLHLLQPDKVFLKESADPDWASALRLLRKMDLVFGALAEAMRALLVDVEAALSAQQECPASGAAPSGWRASRQAVSYLVELDDCARVLALRVTHVRTLYESRDPATSPTVTQRTNLQKQARSVISAAAAVVARREKNYRVPWQRIASWRENPTVYRYGYVWSVHSLYYWWRDQGRAEEGSMQSEWSPCYLNRMDPSEIAVGWGKRSLQLLRDAISRYFPYTLDFVNCFASPSHEYIFPRDIV